MKRSDTTDKWHRHCRGCGLAVHINNDECPRCGIEQPHGARA